MLPRIMPPRVADRKVICSSARLTLRGCQLEGTVPDVEGIVAKLASGRYHADGTSTNCVKIKNPGYTQMTGRHELFERRTGSRKRRPMLRVP